MSALARVGQAEVGPYIKVTHKGTALYYPLAQDEEGRALGGADISTSTLESFSPSAIAGDPSLVSNELLAVLLWSNWQRGMGTVEYREQEGTGSLDSFAYSTLDTRFANMAILPPRRVPLFTLPYSRTDVRFLLNTRDTTYSLVAWDIGNPGVTADIGFVQFNTTTGAFVAINNSGWSYATPTAVREVILFNNKYVAITDVAVFYMTSVGAFYTNWVQTNGGMMGAVVHDNKLYTMARLGAGADWYLYWTTNADEGSPGGTTPWASRSVDPLRLNFIAGEAVVKLVEWKNRQDTRSLFVLTTHRIVAWDDDGYWVEFLPPGTIAGTGADLSVWPQDKAMYFSLADSGANVLQFQNQTISNVSPNKKGGLGGALARTIKRLQGGLNFLFAQGSGAVNAGMVGSATYNSAATYGQIMAYNGQGWHTLAEGTVSNPISGMGWGKNQVVFVRNGVNVETIYAPDAPQPPTQTYGPVTYAEGSFSVESADADAGLELIYKTARYFEIVIDGSDGTQDLPTGHTYTFEWQVDGSGVWQTLALNVGPGLGKYRRLAATTASITDARGVPFRKCRWRLTLTKGVGINSAVTPILRSVALYYLRAPDLIDGIQFAIDLTPGRVKQLYSALGAAYNGKTPEYLHDQLMAMKRSKYNPQLEYGPLRDRTVIPAAEIRVASRENPTTGMGQYIVTARDVSTQTTTLT